jgi:hypothetical protein
MSTRWTYQVIELKPTFLGRLTPETMQAELNRQGALGWELVQVVHSGQPLQPARLVFKREA